MAHDAGADLKAYYRDLYPYATLVSLLELTAPIANREIKVLDVNDVWALHDGRVYRTPTDLREYVHTYERTNRTTGAKFTVPREVREMHIGAAYTGRARPGVRGSELHSNELVFDYDITDCDFLRLEGQPQSRIDECWPLVVFGIQIAISVLEVEFGFHDTIGFFSGRRGAHLWVFDDSAVCLGDEGRAAVLAYATLKTERDGGPMCTQMYEHPNAQRFFPQCREFFEDWVIKPRTPATDGDAPGGGLFDDDGDVLDFFYNRAGLKGVEQLAGVPEAVCWETTDPRRRWKLLVSRVADRRNVPAWCAERLDRAALACVWPRFDEKVTAQGQHARKAPWTVHKKSGRVAEPITRVSDWEIYLPQEAPRVEVLLDPFHPEHNAQRARYRAGCAEVASFVAYVHRKRSERMARDNLLAAAPAVVDSTDVEDLVLNDEAPGLTTGGNSAAVKTLTGYLKLDEPTWARRMTRTLCARCVPGVGIQLGVAAWAVSSSHAWAYATGCQLVIEDRAGAGERVIVDEALRAAAHLEKAGHTKWIRLHRECVLGLLPSRVVGTGTDQDVYAFFDRCGMDPNTGKRSEPTPLRMAPLRFVPKGNEAERQRFESQVLLALDKHVGGLVLRFDTLANASDTDDKRDDNDTDALRTDEHRGESPA